MEDEGKQGFKIKDKRLFDESGNMREQSTPTEEVGSKEAAPAAKDIEGDSFVMHDAPQIAAEEQAPQIDFNSFVMSLATQALIQLGEIPPPEGVNMRPDRLAARQSIDILEMLEQKTKGNLDGGEAKLLEEILHSVRISFLKKS